MTSFVESFQDTADDLPRAYLFSYGSNSTQQLRAQVKNSTILTKPAILKGYVRVFCSKSEDWGGGGVASLAPSKDPKAITHGSVARLTPEEFDLLDEFEKGYRRVNVTVCVGQKSKKEIKAIAFVVGSKPTSPDAPFTPPLRIHPTEQYIWAIHTNLREHWSIDSITVRSNCTKNGVIEVDEREISDIDPIDLSLEALCVEISSYKSHPWVMQRAIDRVVHKLNQVGITDTKELVLALEDPILLNNHIRAKGYSAFQFETLSIMKKLLFPNYIDSNSDSSVTEGDGGAAAADGGGGGGGGDAAAVGSSSSTDGPPALCHDGEVIKEDADDKNKTLVFSYGSNSTQQLRARVQNPNLMTYPATLKGFVRVFCKHSERWGGGGVASLAPSDEPDALTRGAVACLSNKELKLLDSYEGGYRKVNVKIIIGHTNSDEVDAIAYVAGKEPKPNGLFTPVIKCPPTEQYLWAIYGNLREHWSVDTIMIRSNHKEEGPVDMHEKVVSEVEPTDLSLEALCVEVSLNKAQPWIMPQTIKPVVNKLNELGIKDTGDLKEALEDPESLNQQLIDNGDHPFNSETLSIMSKLLFPEQVEEDNLLAEVAASPSSISTVNAAAAAKEAEMLLAESVSVSTENTSNAST